MSKFKFGIVGYGKMGRIRHKTLLDHPDTELVAASDPYSDLRDCDFQTFRNWEDMLDLDLDAVIVCSTNEQIPPAICKALDRGMHVFSEKPPGRTVADIESIVAAEARNLGKKLKFGFNHRYHASVMDARKMIETGELGNLLWMRGVYGKAGGSNYDQQWRNDFSKSGGGILIDQGIHMVDLFHYMCGEFEDVQSMIGKAYWKNVAVEDNAFAIMRNDVGQVAMLHSSATQWRHVFRLEIMMEKGFLDLTGILSNSMSYAPEKLIIARTELDKTGCPKENPSETVTTYNGDKSWEFEMDEFMTAIRGQGEIHTGTSAHALAAMKAVHRIYGADKSWTMPTD